MPAVLINPNLVVQTNDPLTTGVIYMPLSLAYTTASLRKAGIQVQVIDAFAQEPRRVRREGKFWIFGLSYQQIIQQIPPDTCTIFVYAINLTNHISTLGIVKAVKKAYPSVPVIVLENTQAVTAYALRLVAKEFYDAGADYILTGEGDFRAVQFVQALTAGVSQHEIRHIDGLGSPSFYNAVRHPIQDLDHLPFPAWDLFPIKNYWNLRFAHGPQTTKRYLPLLTSRGCPYPCKFCVVPETNNQRWRARSAKNVVDEMAYWVEKYGVREFHIEDLDPTISDERVREICGEIMTRGMEVIWKIAAGTKVETIRSEETIDLMAQAGCRYISISPETGSPRLLKLMRKPFNLQHAVNLIKRMNQVGIRSQACFVLGYPSETEEDLRMTWNLVRDLTRQGVDEIALFMITPVPGSAIYHEFQGYQSLSELNFTPTWRKDYNKLSRFRLQLYGHFLLWKLFYHPGKILQQPWHFLRRRFQTKMEMVPYRALVFRWLGSIAFFKFMNRLQERTQS
jgi:radical SAM superfamily enzyme YgiQ (UPF0313 family)